MIVSYMPRKESTRIYYQINNDKNQYKNFFISIKFFDDDYISCFIIITNLSQAILNHNARM